MAIFSRKKTLGEWASGSLKGEFKTTTTDWEKIVDVVRRLIGMIGAVVVAKGVEAVEKVEGEKTKAAYAHGKSKKPRKPRRKRKTD